MGTNIKWVYNFNDNSKYFLKYYIPTSEGQNIDEMNPDEVLTIVGQQEIDISSLLKQNKQKIHINVPNTLVSFTFQLIFNDLCTLYIYSNTPLKYTFIEFYSIDSKNKLTNITGLIKFNREYLQLYSFDVPRYFCVDDTDFIFTRGKMSWISTISNPNLHKVVKIEPFNFVINYI